MFTLEKSPPPPPLNDEYFSYFRRQLYGTEMEPYPVSHLVGRVALEDRVDAAQAAWEQGTALTITEQELLQLAQEVVFPDLEE